MPIDSKECFAALTEDGQLWEIYQAAQSGGGGGGITSINGDTTAAQTIAGTAPISVSSAAGTTTVTTSMNTARLLGRTTAGVGVAEEITVGTGLSLSAGSLTSTGVQGSVGSVDNAVLRADVGTGIVQNSGIIIDDATATTQTNIAIRNDHSGQTNSALVLTPKGTGALIAGPKPDGTAVGGNARGANAVDLQTVRTVATQVASAAISVIVGGQNNTNSNANSFLGGGQSNSIVGGLGSTHNVICGGQGNSMPSSALYINWSGIVAGNSCTITSESAFVGSGVRNQASGISSVICGGGNRYVDQGHGNTANGNYSAILGGFDSRTDRFGMQAHANGAFDTTYNSTGVGDAQRARFVLRCKTTTNTAVQMALDGATTYLGIPSGKVIACTINISGVKSDGSAVAHYVRQYAVKNVGGTSSEVYAPVTIGTDNAAGTVIALSANNADDTLRIAVTGIAAETWRWVASVDAVEIAYGT